MKNKERTFTLELTEAELKELDSCTYELASYERCKATAYARDMDENIHSLRAKVITLVNKARDKGENMKSTDTNLKIYITEEAREALFKEMQQVNDIGDLLSPSNLEQICLGKTHLPDYAYGQIRRLLKQEFKQWSAEQYNDYVRGKE